MLTASSTDPSNVAAQKNYTLVEDMKGTVRNFLSIEPWKQFFELKGTTDSYGFIRNFTQSNVQVT